MTDLILEKNIQEISKSPPQKKLPKKSPQKKLPKKTKPKQRY